MHHCPLSPQLPLTAVNAKAVACVFISLRNIISIFCCSCKMARPALIQRVTSTNSCVFRWVWGKWNPTSFLWVWLRNCLSYLDLQFIKTFPQWTALFVSGPCSEGVKCSEFLCFRNTQGLQSTTKLAVAVLLMSKTNICLKATESRIWVLRGDSAMFADIWVCHIGGQEVPLHLVGGGQGCNYTSYKVQDSPSQQSYLTCISLLGLQ